MVSLDAANGKELWKTSIAYRSPSVRRSKEDSSRGKSRRRRVYAIDALGMVTAFDAKTGKELLRYGVADAIDFALAGGTLFTAGGASITAMDVSTGSTLWKADTSYGKPLFLAVAGEQVFIISNYESGDLSARIIEVVRPDMPRHSSRKTERGRGAAR